MPKIDLHRMAQCKTKNQRVPEEMPKYHQDCNCNYEVSLYQISYVASDSKYIPFPRSIYWKRVRRLFHYSLVRYLVVSWFGYGPLNSKPWNRHRLVSGYLFALRFTYRYFRLQTLQGIFPKGRCRSYHTLGTIPSGCLTSLGTKKRMVESSE